MSKSVPQLLQAYERWVDEPRTHEKFARHLDLEDLHTLVLYYIDIDTPEQLYKRLEGWIDEHHSELETIAEISDVDFGED